MFVHVFEKISLLLMTLLTSSCPSQRRLKGVGEVFISNVNEIEYSILFQGCTERYLSFEINAPNYHAIEYKDPEYKARGFYIKSTDDFDYVVSDGISYYRSPYGNFFGKIEFDGYAQIDLYLSEKGLKSFANKCNAYVEITVLSMIIGHLEGGYCLFVEI